MKQKYLYGYWQGVRFLVKDKSTAAHLLRMQIKGAYNLKLKKETNY